MTTHQSPTPAASVLDSLEPEIFDRLELVASRIERLHAKDSHSFNGWEARDIRQASAALKTLAAQPAPGVGGWVDTMVEILRTSLDADIDAGESLHTLVIRASNALYWRGKEIEELRELLAARPAESVAQGGEDGEYSQGIMGDGAAILHNGVPMTIDTIVATLNRTTPATGSGGEESK